MEQQQQQQQQQSGLSDDQQQQQSVSGAQSASLAATSEAKLRTLHNKVYSTTL
jgi:hypothetical protein